MLLVSKRTLFDIILEKRKLTGFANCDQHPTGDGIVWLSARARPYRIAWAGDYRYSGPVNEKQDRPAVASSGTASRDQPCCSLAWAVLVSLSSTEGNSISDAPAPLSKRTRAFFLAPAAGDNL